MDADRIPKEKPSNDNKWLPIMYCTFFGMFKESAEKHGYCLAVHGSLTRDMDLILVPWTEDPDPVTAVLKDWEDIVGDVPREKPYTSRKEKPHGRVAYTIPTGAGGYVDVSVINGIEDPEPPCPACGFTYQQTLRHENPNWCPECGVL